MTPALAKRPKKVNYPPPGCTGTPKCRACFRNKFTFRCSDCREEVAYCVGGSDDNRCAECWCKAQKRRGES